MVGCGPSKMGSICLSGGVWLQTPVPTLGQMDQTKSQAFVIPWPGNLDTVTLPGGQKGFKLFMVDTCSFVRGSGSPFSNVVFPPQTFCEYSLHCSCCYCFVQIKRAWRGNLMAQKPMALAGLQPMWNTESADCDLSFIIRLEAHRSAFSTTPLDFYIALFHMLSKPAVPIPRYCTLVAFCRLINCGRPHVF